MMGTTVPTQKKSMCVITETVQSAGALKSVNTDLAVNAADPDNVAYLQTRTPTLETTNTLKLLIKICVRMPVSN